MMAAQSPLRFVQHHERRAAPAITNPSAGVAVHHRGVTAPVQEQQGLLTFIQPQLQRSQQ